MQIEIDCKKFLKELEIAGKFVNLKAQGVGNGVVISATEKGDVNLTAFDNGKYQGTIKYKIKSACVNEAGDNFVEFNRLKALLKSVSANEVILEDRALKFDGGEITFEPLSMEEVYKYPEITNAEELYELPAKELKRLLSDVIPAISVPTDFPRYVNACLLGSEKEHVITVATDGRKLAVAKYHCGNIKQDKDLFLNSDSAKGLHNALEVFNDNVKVLVDGPRVWVKSDDSEFSAKWMDDVNFPLYERILNKTVEASLVCLKKDLEEAVKKVNTIAKTTTSHIMGLNIYPGQGVIMAAHSGKIGDLVTTFSKGKIEGKNLVLGINALYLLEALKTLGDGEIIIEFSGEETQIRFYRANDRKGLEYLLMPCHLSPAERALIDTEYPED